MKPVTRIALTFAFTAAAALAQPAPAAVVNPASNIPAGLPNAGIAQGSIFVVYGTAMGPSAIAQPTALPLPSTLGGTSISVTVSGTTVNAPMIYSLASQVAAVLPSNTPVGTGTLTVTYNGASGSTPIQVVQTNFGSSTVNQSGTGAGVVTTPGYQLITGTNPAKPGDTVVLWGTGLGPISGSDAALPTGGDLGTPISIYVGSSTAKIAYRGRSAAPGLDQINFVIPSGVTGCAVSLAIVTQGSSAATVSNTTTIPISSDGGPCSDANGISLSLLNGPLSKGSVAIGSIGLFQSTSSFSISIPGAPSFSQTTTASGASASFFRYSASQFTQSAGSISTTASIGSCTVTTVRGTPSTGSTPATTYTGLDAGSAITLNLPSGSSVSLNAVPAAGKGIYSWSTQASLSAGVYKASGPGGADVGAFTASLNLGQPLTWTNQSAIVAAGISRVQPLQVTWTGGDPAGFVEIYGYSSITTSGNSSVGAVFTCIAPAGPGSFQVPPAVLLSLPASSVTSGIPLGFLGVGGIAAPVQFSAPGIDLGILTASSISGSLVAYQ